MTRYRGITSAEAFGTPSTEAPVIIAPTGIASGFGMGALVLTPDQPIAPSGIGTGYAFDNAVVSLGNAQGLAPFGIASAAAFGTAAISYPQSLAPTGVSTGYASGTPTIGIFLSVSPDGLSTGYASGTAQLNRRIPSNSVTTSFAAGTAKVNQTISGSGGIDSAEVVSDPAEVYKDDPTRWNMTGLWRDYPNNGISWPGTASAGTSGSRALSDQGVASLSSLNGYGATYQTGGGPAFTSSIDWADLIGDGSACSGYALINPEGGIGGAVHYPSGGSGITLGASTTGGTVDDGNANYVSESLTGNDWLLITWRCDGTDFEMGVNEVPGTAGGGSVTTGNGNAASGGTVRLGDNWTGYVAEIGVASEWWDSSRWAALLTYINDRYGLSL